MEIVNDVTKQGLVDFEQLTEGQCFRFSRDSTALYMKTGYGQDAVDLSNGEYSTDLCGEKVFFVKAEVHIIG